MGIQPEFGPAVAATRRSVRSALNDTFGRTSAARGRTTPTGQVRPLVLVALSGGADSLALAAAVAVEAPRLGVRAGAVIIDHGLQEGSAAVAERAAEQARGLGLDPVQVERVAVFTGDAAQDRASLTGGTESAARAARYEALQSVALSLGAEAIMTAHTRDDQAEQVLLGLARGSGTRSIAGIPRLRELGDGVLLVRPFLVEVPEITRNTTEQACLEQRLEPWQDPHNADTTYTRVRVRHRILPALEAELGPGVARALARSADLAREDADALDALVREQIEDLVEHAEAGIAVSVAALAANPQAIRARIVRAVAEAEFGAQLSAEHTRSITALVTDWRGQGPAYVPGIRVTRRGSRLHFERQSGSPRETSGRS